jgi:CubicO group peptidase (beta-lactamase class C family)
MHLPLRSTRWLVARTLTAPLLAASLAAAIAPTVATAQQGPEPAAALIARIEAPRIPGDTGLAGRTLREVLTAANVPGASIAVVHDYQLHWAKGYGVADATSNRPVTASTRFQAASISKPLTAMAVMSLVQDGQFALDADINETLRSWKVPESELTRTQKVTWRSLLSHTSGSDDGFGFPGYKPDAQRPTLVHILNGESPSNVKAVTFARPPYLFYKYSGGGTTIVQLALTDLTQRDFPALLRERVLTPLGMLHSDFTQPAPDSVHAMLAHAHSAQGRTMNAPWHVYPELAAAGLWTTASDLAQVVIEIQTARRDARGRVLTNASAREMTSLVGVGPFAVGMTVSRSGEGWYFSHGGSNWGFRANVEGHLRHGYGLVVMTNGDAGGRVIAEVRERVSLAYGWDSKAEALRR